MRMKRIPFFLSFPILIIRFNLDPEHPHTLDQLNVVHEDSIQGNGSPSVYTHMISYFPHSLSISLSIHLSTFSLLYWQTISSHSRRVYTYSPPL